MTILTKSLSGHNLKGDYWNALNFVVRKFLNGVHVCTKFHENWKGWGFFFVDLAWNDPIGKIEHNATILFPMHCT